MRSVAGLVVTATFLTCVSAPAQAAPVRYRDLVFDDTVITRPDEVYGQAVNSLGELEVLKLDVHEPAGDTADHRAAIVWVHGGYFVRGDKTSYASTIREFARAGFVVASIDYRLRVDGDFPESTLQVVSELRLNEYIDAVIDAQHDAQAAIRWVRAHAEELHVDPERVAIVGHSAGGLTSTSVAFNSEDPGNSGLPETVGFSSRPMAAVILAGGGAPALTANIGMGEPPVLFVHGLADQIVPYVAAALPCVATLAMLNVCEQVLDPDQEHDVFGLAEAREFLHRFMIVRPPLRLPIRLTLVGFP